MSSIDETLKNLPELPGVYIMRDIDGTIIYVGKAKNLKNRVKSYFQNRDDRDSKTRCWCQILIPGLYCDPYRRGGINP